MKTPTPGRRRSAAGGEAGDDLDNPEEVARLAGHQAGPRTTVGGRASSQAGTPRCVENSREVDAAATSSTQFHSCETPSSQPRYAEQCSTCCDKSCSERSGPAQSCGSDTLEERSRNFGKCSPSQTVGPSQDPMHITCSIIRHMSTTSAPSGLSASTKSAEAPPQPRLDSSVPKLWYFNARGRAEIIRLIFAQAGVEYEDLRFREPPYAMEDFRHFKQTHDLPFGQVPVLEIDGMLLAQSQAIVRYLSCKYNLMADDDVGNVRAGGNLEETETLVECFVKDTCQRWGTYFEKLLKKNGGVWMVGDHVTYADLSVYDVLSSIRWRLPMCFSQSALLLEHSRRVEALPGIAAYLRRRPDVPI